MPRQLSYTAARETTPKSANASADIAPRKLGQKRRGYNCGRCGVPKRGHRCPPSAAATLPGVSLRRALSFNEIDVSISADRGDNGDNFPSESASDPYTGELPAICLWEVLRRLPPDALLSAAMVCRGWRDTARRLWRAAEELRVRVPPAAQLGFVGSVLQKCSCLVKLSLRMQSDVDATVLACIAFSCPNLKSVEISMADSATNRITGDELGRFVADKQYLSCFKMGGCYSLGGFILRSSSLSTIWLSDLHSLSKTIFNCPNLREISLDFSLEENDSTDLTAMVDGFGRSCPRLISIHIASAQLSHAVALALTAANFRGLKMLSLVLGSEITDASVAAIVSSYPNLELLDLSGSSISDSSIGMICNVCPETLSRLLLALCPNITSSGIQFATAQLPLLELMDCGMTLCDPNSQSQFSEENSDLELEKMSNCNPHLIYQKLIIKHSSLKKLSLWGCSSLDALCLNCPELNDLNLNCCTNLHPERLLLQCPSLESVHASGCQHVLIGAIQSQVQNSFDAAEYHFPCKRFADGSKRIRASHFLYRQPSDDEKGGVVRKRRHCNVLVG